MTRSAYSTIRLNHLQHNLQTIRNTAANSKLMAVIKADAYGHGMLRVAEALKDADAYAVACVNEGLLLREANLTLPIVCLQGFQNIDELKHASQQGIELVVHSDHQLRLLETTALTSSVDVWLKLDTGMGRLGIDPSEAAKYVTALQNMPNVNQVRLMTHFANADSQNDIDVQRQLDTFQSSTQSYTQLERSCANSAAVLNYPQSHLDWVRPGLVLYGVSPFEDGKARNLKPVMSLHAPLISIRNHHKNDTIGYGSTYTCPEDMRIGIVAAGYGDGYPRSLSQTTNVYLNGQQAPIVGRVSMDMITIDLREIEADTGDQVELWGEHIDVGHVARSANTLSYEPLCAMSGRIDRRYL